MDIDKTDFVDFLTEFGSDIFTASSCGLCYFKGIYVPLQSSKQLLDVKLVPGDAVVYADPAESLTLGDILSFQGKSFLLVSNSKIQYINGNPIYLELGLSRFLPCLDIQSSYDIRTSISLSVSSLYDITQNLFSLSLSSSYDIPSPVSASIQLSSSYDIPSPISASFQLPSSYDITQNLFSLSLSSSYDIPSPVSASIQLPSSYDLQVAPQQVTGLRAEADDERNIWTFWIPIEDEDLDYYKVHRSTADAFTPSNANLVGVPKVNQFVHKDLNSVTKYYFKVCAVSKNGAMGDYSDQTHATTVE